MSRSAHLCLRALLVWALCISSVAAHARIGLLVGEPFGSFGTMMPVGHASIYLDNICAATSTRLRPCQPGESGVVLSRYHDLKSQKIDWLAIPAFTFFYGVSSPDQIPTYVTPELEAELRESYRQANLLDIVPDRIDKHGNPNPPPYGDWEEGIGSAFDRNLLLYTLRTTPQQDAQLLAFLNADPNLRRYTLGRANCADFAADLLNIVVPGLPHRNIPADFDMTTPKNLARLIDAYGRANLSAGLQVYEISQLPGSLRRSRPLRGSAEIFLKTKRYLATLLVLQPEIVLTDWIAYETRGRWTPGLDATPMSPNQWSDTLLARTTPPPSPPNPVKPPDTPEIDKTPVTTGDLNSQTLAYPPPPIN
jgi:hypothetical protein